MQAATFRLWFFIGLLLLGVYLMVAPSVIVRIEFRPLSARAAPVGTASMPTLVRFTDVYLVCDEAAISDGTTISLATLSKQ